MVKDNIPGLEALKSADLMVAFLRWRELPDDQMKHLIDYTESGRPIIGIRNATHPFRYAKRPDSPYAKYDSGSKDPEGGWGRAVLGETWVSHYGKNLVESTQCLTPENAAGHPILKGVPKSFWIPDDVYGINPLQGDCTPILLGQPLVGWKSDDPPHPDKKPVPIAWTKNLHRDRGKSRAGIHHHDGPRRRLQDRGVQAGHSERLLLGVADGRPDRREEPCESRGSLRSGRGRRQRLEKRESSPRI